MRIIHQRLFYQLVAGITGVRKSKRKEDIRDEGSLELIVGKKPFHIKIAEFDDEEEKDGFLKTLYDAPEKEVPAGHKRL